jgi:cytochrome c
MMAAHPQHSKEDAERMAKYILSLAVKQKTLPVNGGVTFNAETHRQTGGNYILRAIYTDKGGPVVGSLTGSEMMVFRNPKVEAEDFVIDKKMSIVHPDGEDRTLVGNINHSAYISLTGIDLSGIKGLNADVVSLQKGGVMEMHIDTHDGPIIAKTDIPDTDPGKPSMQHVKIPLKTTVGKHDIYLVFKNNSGVLENIAFIDWIRFNN